MLGTEPGSLTLLSPFPPFGFLRWDHVTRLLWGKGCFICFGQIQCVGKMGNGTPTCAQGPMLGIESRPVDKAYAQRN